ncbi:hypothetical protein B0H16DRAFT_1310364 [Mycena metata]|uniref:L domain-like protein n=1 Tax=Mycena metata TaxID=1033252 RepID=A0AAD7JHX3_9AGAR|nr:hypothetical protein B0H16DRAFT_1310364 [Mycena metata]
MSRIPQPSRGTPRKAPTTPAASSGTPRTRTKSTFARAPTPSKSPRKPFADDSFLDNGKTKQEEPASKPLTIKEAIALKRAQAKKAEKAHTSNNAPSPLDDFSSLADANPFPPPPAEDEDILGRPPLRDTIERAKSTGSINLSTRSLQCIPSALFDIHLGITPQPLKSVPQEPPLPPAPPETGRKRPGPAWFEIQDLETLKAWGNDIEEIQPEIALFGSLKTVDLHKNKISSLPAQFADLAALSTLDLSHNALTTLPPDLFSLPALTNLNVAHNELTALPFSVPFSGAAAKAKPSRSTSLFAVEVSRASTLLPKLVILDASHNKLTAASIDRAAGLPVALVTLDLSGNPLENGNASDARALFTALGALSRLKTLRCDSADVSDAVFDGTATFPNLSLLDLGSTNVTEAGAAAGLKAVKQTLSFEVTKEDPAPGTVRVIIGKKIVREAWELEAERRSKARGKTAEEGVVGLEWENAAAVREPKGGQAAAKPTVKPKVAAPVVKEAWEIEAEQGLLTEGGKRRARAAAAAAAAASGSGDPSDLGRGAPPRQGSPTKSAGFSLADPQYYTARTETLVLPASTPPKLGSGHARAFSLAPTSTLKATSTSPSDVALPTPTLPLSLIAAQPFAATLRVLKLANRRLDRSFALPPLPLPGTSAPLLPRLEELSLEGCNLGDGVAVSFAGAADSGAGLQLPSENRPTLPLLAELFPGLRVLNMAYNTLTGAALTEEVLTALILPSHSISSPESADENATPLKGLKQLHLRGNRIAALDGFHTLALHLFKGNRAVSGWGLEELDLRDNEIGKLPAEMGMLPLDVLLVDGNVFRVPARRVWEREGTKGLLSWLRGRME